MPGLSVPIKLGFLLCVESPPVATGEWYETSRLFEDFHVLPFNVIIKVSCFSGSENVEKE